MAEVSGARREAAERPGVPGPPGCPGPLALPAAAGGRGLPAGLGRGGRAEAAGAESGPRADAEPGRCLRADCGAAAGPRQRRREERLPAAGSRLRARGGAEGGMRASEVRGRRTLRGALRGPRRPCPLQAAGRVPRDR